MPKPLFVRVKDRDTGYEFDVPETSLLLRRGAVVRVKPVLYPPSRTQRAPKHHVSLAGQSARRQQAGRPVAPDQASDKEN